MVRFVLKDEQSRVWENMLNPRLTPGYAVVMNHMLYAFG
jgi:hypothetical protein